MGRSRSAFAQQRQKHNRTRIPPSVRLAIWRIRRTWHLLALAQLCFLVAIVLACAVPLFSEVAATAGLQSAIPADPAVRQLNAAIHTNKPSETIINQSGHQLDMLIKRYLADFGVGHPTFSLVSQSIPLSYTADQPNADTVTIEALQFGEGDPMPQIVQGRLPRTNPGDIEIALSFDTAAKLHLHVGSNLLLGGQRAEQPAGLVLNVVGIIADSAIVNGDSLRPRMQVSGSSGDASGVDYPVLAKLSALLTARIPWDSFAPAQSPYGMSAVWVLNWAYPMDLSHLDADGLDAAVEAAHSFSDDARNMLSSMPLVQDAFASSETFTILDAYSARARSDALIVAMLQLPVFGLVVLFAVFIANVLVAYQSNEIVTLRSRGASRRQIVVAFSIQSVVLGGIGIVVGTLLALQLVRMVAAVILPTTALQVLNSLAVSPTHYWRQVGVFPICAAICTIIAMIWELHRASMLNIQTLREEAAGRVNRSFWLRFHLDVLFAVLAIGGYAGLALAQRVYLRVPLLAVLAPLALMGAFISLFLRLYPYLLRASAWIAARSRGAPASLALTRAARTPQYVVRAILMLSLSTAFVVFTLIGYASLQQRVRDIADLQAGADFSGGISPLTADTVSGHDTLATETADYRHIPGVLSASLGYRSISTLRTPISVADAAGLESDISSVQILAVDTETFGSTATWDRATPSQSLPSLLRALASARDTVMAGGAVPAVVDSRLWDALHLSAGTRFTLPLTSTHNLHFVAIGQVQTIPTVSDVETTGIVVDFQIFATAYAHVMGTAAPSPNFCWLHTRGDAASIASVRAAVTHGPLELSPLSLPNAFIIPVSDRRALLAKLERDPLQVGLVGVLGIGAGSSMLLALAGMITAAWLDISSQFTVLALLRTLGARRCQIVSMFVWEFGCTNLMAVAVGAILGLGVAAVILPALPQPILAGEVIMSNHWGLQLVVPIASLGLAGGVLVVTSGVIITVATRVATRPALYSTLRLTRL